MATTKRERERERERSFPNLFSVRVCLCRLVVLDELVVHELEGDGGLADAAVADDDELERQNVVPVLSSITGL